MYILYYNLDAKHNTEMALISSYIVVLYNTPTIICLFVYLYSIDFTFLDQNTTGV